METLYTAPELDNLLGLFCKYAGFNETKFSSMFEFTAYVGFWPINVLDRNIRDMQQVQPPPEAQKILAQLMGPHGKTLVRAYMINRRSWRGRPKVFLIKLCHLVGFVLAAIAAFFIETING